MTKKIVRDHDMLGLQGVESLRLRDIADLPLYPFFYPRFDCDYIPRSNNSIISVADIRSKISVPVNCRATSGYLPHLPNSTAHLEISNACKMSFRSGSCRPYPPCHRINLRTDATSLPTLNVSVLARCSIRRRINSSWGRFRRKKC